MLHRAALHTQEFDGGSQSNSKETQFKTQHKLMQAKAGSEEQQVCSDCHAVLFANTTFCGLHE